MSNFYVSPYFFLVLSIFLVISASGLAFVLIMNKKKTIADRILDTQDIEQDTKPKEKIKGKLFERIENDLKSGNSKIDIKTFLVVIFISSIVLYIVAFSLFGQPLIAIAPLPFTLYFIPKTYIDSLKQKQLDTFEAELVQILRRMSSILKNGSVLQALEDVKDSITFSEKSRIMLNEIYHRYKYGDSIESAFYKVAEKSGSHQFMLCAISIDINKELGADLSTTIGNIAMNIQKQQLVEKETKSLKASTVMIGKVMSVMPFGIIGFIAEANPNYFRDYLQTLSNQMIFLGLLMWMFVGVFILNKMGNQK